VEIEAVKELRTKLQNDTAELLEKFEDDTGLLVTELQVGRYFDLNTEKLRTLVEVRVKL